MQLVVIGGGPAGYVSALTAKRAGAEVTLIEKDELGGTCLNKGCIPTKTIIHSIETFNKLKELKHGTDKPNLAIATNLSELLEKKDYVVETQRKGLYMLLKQSGVKIIKDEAELINTKTVVLKNSFEKITADNIIIATGSRPAELPMLSFDGKQILSSDDLWNMKEVPKSITIVGAGAIGCEFAWIFHLLGSKVTLIELMPRVLPMEDEEISKTLERAFKKRKIEFYTSVKIEELKKTDEAVEILLSNSKKISSEVVLVSVGRAYNTEFLKNSEIKIGKKGEILVDEYLKTNLEGVYAVGDVNGKWLLAHVAYKEGEISAKNIFGYSEKMDYSIIPSTIFTALEVSSVGLRENEALQKGIAIKKGTFPYRAIGKAHAIGEIDGSIKVLVEKETDVIIGAHIIGAKASEIIHELALAIKLKAKAKDVAELIHSHPTLSEGIKEACADIYGEAIHKI